MRFQRFQQELVRANNGGIEAAENEEELRGKRQLTVPEGFSKIRNELGEF